MADAKPILLIAEDNKLIADVLQKVFSRKFDVRSYEKGEDAIKALQDIGRPVVMLTDNGLEGSMTGFDLIEQARALHPDMPAVMLSGYVSPEGQQKLQALNVPLVNKPALPIDIEPLLEAALRKLEGGRTPIQHAIRPRDKDGRGPA
ncbi:MAG: response regulator [Alphaproteobacteria bacterium]